MKVILKKKGHSFTLGRTETIYIIDTTQHAQARHLPFLVAIVGLHDCPSVCKL